MRIEVYRAGGDRPGPPIVEPMLADVESLLLARGTAELDARAQPMVDVTVECLPYPGLKLGQLVTLPDASGTQVAHAISGIRLIVKGAEVIAQLSLERPE